MERGAPAGHNTDRRAPHPSTPRAARPTRPRHCARTRDPPASCADASRTPTLGRPTDETGASPAPAQIAQIGSITRSRRIDPTPGSSKSTTQLRLIVRRAFGFHSYQAPITLAMLALGGLPRPPRPVTQPIHPIVHTTCMIAVLKPPAMCTVHRFSAWPPSSTLTMHNDKGCNSAKYASSLDSTLGLLTFCESLRCSSPPFGIDV